MQDLNLQHGLLFAKFSGKQLVATIGCSNKLYSCHEISSWKKYFCNMFFWKRTVSVL